MKYVVLCSRIVWRLIALTIIFLAVIITLGREFAYKLPDYQAQIDGAISDRLSMRVHSSHMSSDWSGFSPSLTVENLDIYSHGAEQPVISASALKAHPDFLGSLLDLNLQWQELSVEHLSLALLELEDGSWTLSGMPGQESKTDTTQLLDMLQQSTYLKINEAVLQVTFSSGEHSVIRLRDMLLENSGTFHRLAASVAFEDATESAKLIIEGKGDLFDVERFNGTAYLKLQRLNFQGPVSALLKRWVPAIAEQRDFEAAVEAELWLSKTQAKGARLSGYLQAAEIPLLGLADVEPIKNFKTEITGRYRPGEDWNVTLQDIDFQWPGWEIDPLTINYRQKLGDPLGYGTISIDHFNLETLSELLQTNSLLPKKGLEVLAALKPKGNINAAHVQIQPSGEKDKPRVSLQANLQDVAIASWKKAPASRGINGFLEIQGGDGLLELDSPNGFAMHYPTVYDDYMVHPSARGQIRWRIDREADAVRVSSGPIEIGGEKGQGAAYLYLDIPLQRKYGPGEMFLQVGLRDSHSRYRNEFIPRTLNPKLLAWLDSAIGDTALDEAGFVWRGSLAKGENLKRSFQLYLKAKNGTLAFQPDWPMLRQLEAVITVDGSNVTARVDRGRLGDVDIGETEVLVRTNDNDEAAVLSVKGLAQGDAGAAVKVLAESPLQQRVGVLPEWPLEGAATVAVDLKIPLTAGDEQPSYRVDAQIQDATLTDPKGKFVFERLQGTLRYRDSTGLTGEALKANLWGNNPLAGSLKTVDNDIVLTMDGKIDTSVLLGKLELPIDRLMAGRTRYQAELVLASEQPVRLDISSSFQGIAIDLPEPFGKPADQPSGFNLSTVFDDNQTTIKGDHNQQLYFAFALMEGALTRGILSFNKPTTLDQVSEGLRLDGLLHHVNIDDWLPVYEKFGAFGEKEPALAKLVTLKIDRFAIDKLTLQDLSLSGSPDERKNWRFSFVSDIAIGEATLPSDREQPIKLDLQSLNLAESQAETQEGSPFAEINPAELPHVDFSVDKLMLGDSLYGSLAFVMEPQEQGVELRNINGELLGLVLGVNQLEEDGESDIGQETRLLWAKDSDGYYSRFSGVVGAKDVADFLANFDEPKIIDSKQATFVMDLAWRGAPDQINRDSLAGSLALELESGEFYRSPKGASNAVIRVVGLFNFANWVRRLKLDFSDLFAKGMTYDSLRGGVSFDQGVMTFDSPIVVKMPSGRMKWSGSADLLGEQLDAYLVMTVPLGTNLPWVVALAGGLPAAAGVYITSKLFEKQLDKLSSLSYEVTGSWDDPDIKVDRIFSDKGAAADSGAGEKGEESNE